jgi:hypothetical protein
VVARLPLQLAGCAALQQRLRAGDFSLVAPRLRDMDIGGQRMALVAVDPAPPDCTANGASAGSPR